MRSVGERTLIRHRHIHACPEKKEREIDVVCVKNGDELDNCSCIEEREKERERRREREKKAWTTVLFFLCVARFVQRFSFSRLLLTSSQMRRRRRRIVALCCCFCFCCCCCCVHVWTGHFVRSPSDYQCEIIRQDAFELDQQTTISFECFVIDISHSIVRSSRHASICLFLNDDDDDDRRATTWPTSSLRVSICIHERLVGSEMCIRDRIRRVSNKLLPLWEGEEKIGHLDPMNRIENETSLSVCVDRSSSPSPTPSTIVSDFFLSTVLFRHNWTWEIRLLLLLINVYQETTKPRDRDEDCINAGRENNSCLSIDQSNEINRTSDRR